MDPRSRRQLPRAAGTGRAPVSGDAKNGIRSSIFRLKTELARPFFRIPGSERFRVRRPQNRQICAAARPAPRWPVLGPARPRTASRPRHPSRAPPGTACGLGYAEGLKHSRLRRLEIDAERWVEPALPLVHVPGRVGDESRLPEPFVHRIVHVTVDPECGLVSLDELVQIGGERGVQRIVLEPLPDRARARRVVRDHHHSFAGKLRPCELFLDETPGGPMPSDGLSRAEGPPMVSNRAREVRYAPAQPMVCPDLVGLAVELQIRPQGRPDEARALDPDHAGVEEVDPDFRALFGESRPRVVDLRTVELVVPEDVDDVRGRSPELRQLRHQSLRVGRKVAGEDDDIGLGMVLRHRSAMLEVEIGEDLDLHRWQHKWGRSLPRNCRVRHPA